MSFLLIIPVLGFLALFFVCYENFNSGAGSRIREAFLQAVVFTGLYIVAVTEILSYHKNIHFTYVLISWLVYLAIPSVLLLFSSMILSGVRDIIRKCVGAVRSSPELWITIIFMLVSSI